MLSGLGDAVMRRMVGWLGRCHGWDPADGNCMKGEDEDEEMENGVRCTLPVLFLFRSPLYLQVPSLATQERSFNDNNNSRTMNRSSEAQCMMLWMCTRARTGRHNKGSLDRAADVTDLHLRGTT